MAQSYRCYSYSRARPVGTHYPDGSEVLFPPTIYNKMWDNTVSVSRPRLFLPNPFLFVIHLYHIIRNPTVWNAYQCYWKNKQTPGLLIAETLNVPFPVSPTRQHTCHSRSVQLSSFILVHGSTRRTNRHTEHTSTDANFLPHVMPWHCNTGSEKLRDLNGHLTL